MTARLLLSLVFPLLLAACSRQEGRTSEASAPARAGTAVEVAREGRATPAVVGASAVAPPAAPGQVLSTPVRASPPAAPSPGIADSSVAGAAEAGVLSRSSSARPAAGGPMKSPKAKASSVILAGSRPVLPLAVVAAGHPQIFTPEQTPVLSRLGEEFLAATADTPVLPAPAPATPAVSAAAADSLDWMRAQIASDHRFKSMFGNVAFNAMLLERAREAAPAAP